MAMSKRNANAMVVMNFLYRIVEVFEDYFTELVEESIRDNFVITYELLDEMMDFGYPQSTEPKVLKESGHTCTHADPSQRRSLASS